MDGVLHSDPHGHALSHHIIQQEMQLHIYKFFVFCMAIWHIKREMHK